MAKRFLLTLSCIICAQFACTPQPTEMSYNATILALDEVPILDLPRNFRTTQNQISKKNGPNLEGLRELKMSGSGQFSKNSFKQALKKMAAPIYVVDLRRESHGFINGMPFTWYEPYNFSNDDKNALEIKNLEKSLINALSKKKKVAVNQVLKKKDGLIIKTLEKVIPIESAETEEQLVKGQASYLRLPVMDHHRPEDEVVDSFITFMKSLPEKSWIHFHCRGGEGRTTTFMIMVDMIENAQKVSFSDIVNRQIMIGGSNLLETSYDPEKFWNEEASKDRLEFLKKFYYYAADEKAYPDKTWSDWLKKNP